jgi:hypothetical protein
VFDGQICNFPFLCQPPFPDLTGCLALFVHDVFYSPRRGRKTCSGKQKEQGQKGQKEQKEQNKKQKNKKHTYLNI